MTLPNLNLRRRALVGAAAAGIALTGLAALPADAAGTGTFLTRTQLPKAGGPWTASAQKAGLPKPMYTCVKGVVPAAKSRSVTFHGDMTAEVRETITVTNSYRDAKKLVHDLRSAITNCHDRLRDVTRVDRIGKWTTEDGLSLDAVYTAPPNSEYNYQLFAVGRDGRAVVLTTYSDVGRKGEAPIAAFTSTAKRGLSKAF
jgi:hypothetical protein